jgi:hypothetical protein
MEEIKKILIAVDLSRNSLRAVTYVGEMINCHPLVRVTLLHVVREPSPDIESNAEARRAQVERQKAEALRLMEEAAQKLIATKKNLPANSSLLRNGESCRPHFGRTASWRLSNRRGWPKRAQQERGVPVR